MTASFWQFLTEINPRTVVDVLSAGLTPTIAVIATYVAYQQWRINKTRLDLALYDRRLAVYKAVDTFYGEIAIPGAIKYQMIFTLHSATAEARFLFPKEIETHLAKLHDKGMRAAALRERLYPSSGEHGLPVGDARSKAVDEEAELVREVQVDLRAESRKLFGKYLTLA